MTSLATRRCLIICASLTTFVAIMFSAYFVYLCLVKDVCYAHAKLVQNKIVWKWDVQRCSGQIEHVDETAVKITSDGIYITNIQILSTCKNMTDITLKMLPSNANYVSGSFQNSPTGTYYATMSQILLLNKNDELNLTINGANCISRDTKSTQWKILKVFNL